MLLPSLASELQNIANNLIIPEELKKFKSKIKAKKAKEVSKKFNVFAIDSSYSTPPLDVLNGEFYVYSYGYLSNLGDKEIVYGVKLSEREEITNFLIKKERELAIRIIEERGDKVDIIILDGPINNFPGAPFKISSELFNTLKRLLNLARENNVTIIGFPKRVRSLYVAMLCNMSEKHLVYDRAAITYILDENEYFVIGKLRDIVEKYARYLKSIGKTVDRAKDAITKLPLYGDVYIIAFKTNIGNKVEIFANEEQLEEIISYLIKLCGKNVFPFILDEVDKFVRITRDDTLNAYINLLKIASKEAIKNILLLANPQKKYLFAE